MGVAAHEDELENAKGEVVTVDLGHVAYQGGDLALAIRRKWLTEQIDLPG